jgi:hypothetical protein
MVNAVEIGKKLSAIGYRPGGPSPGSLGLATLSRTRERVEGRSDRFRSPLSHVWERGRG